MSSFMSASMEQKQQSSENSINFGVMGGVEFITTNYTVDFIVYYANQGVNQVSHSISYKTKCNCNQLFVF